MFGKCLLAAALLLAFEITGCRSKPPVQSQANSGVTSSGEATTSWRIELKVAPEHPRMVKPATLTVHIVDGGGKTVDDAQVTGALTMKTMDMGKSEVKFEPKGNGDYQGTVKEMDMAGPWEVAVEAKQGGFHAVKKFEVVVEE